MERLSDGLQPSKNAPLFYLINYLVHFRPELVQRIASPGDSPFDHQNTTVLCPLHVSQACEHTKLKKNIMRMNTGEQLPSGREEVASW